MCVLYQTFHIWFTFEMVPSFLRVTCPGIYPVCKIYIYIIIVFFLEQTLNNIVLCSYNISDFVRYSTWSIMYSPSQLFIFFSIWRIDLFRRSKTSKFSHFYIQILRLWQSVRMQYMQQVEKGLILFEASLKSIQMCTLSWLESWVTEK